MGGKLTVFYAPGNRRQSKWHLLFKLLIASSPLLLTNGPVKALAAQGQVKFGANLTTQAICTIMISQEGTLAMNPNGTQLSSMLPGGKSAKVNVFALFPYEISVDRPPFFTTRPAGGDQNVTFNSYFSGSSTSGNHSFPKRPGNNSFRFPGFFNNWNFTIDLEANRPDPFPSGQYSTYTIVRCE